MKLFRLFLLAFVFHLAAFAQDGQQQFASLGDFKLESGEAIRDCRLGYRTFGQLNSDKSNAILFPTWSNWLALARSWTVRSITSSWWTHWAMGFLLLRPTVRHSHA